MHGSSEGKDPGAYLWCDPAKVGASPRIGVNAQSGRANIILLSKSLGVPLNATQAQALLDTNQGMIEGGGYTASEISFTLACMKVLNTLRHSFSVKGWRVLDESDETGNRYVQASMSLVVGDGHGDHDARRGFRPGGRADQGDAAGAGEVVPGRRATAAGHIQRDGDRRGGARYGGACARDGELPRRRAFVMDDGGGEQRSEPGRADGDCGRVPLLAAEKPGIGAAQVFSIPSGAKALLLDRPYSWG